MKSLNYLINDIKECFDNIESYKIDEDAFGELNRTYSNTMPTYFEATNTLVYTKDGYFMIDKKEFFDFRCDLSHGKLFTKVMQGKFTTLREAMLFMKSRGNEINSIDLQMHYDRDGYLFPSYVVSTYKK